MSKDKKFLDIKAKTYKNKNNGQVLLILPKKMIKRKFNKDEEEPLEIPKRIPIRLFEWK